MARRTKKLLSADAIGVKVGKAVNRHKVGKHFILTIQDSLLRFERDEASTGREAQLDGIYIVRTSEPAEALSAGDTYKSLGQLERAFRCMKIVDLRVRPVRDRSEAHVRAHIFFCMLAYYVEWRMRAGTVTPWPRPSPPRAPARRSARRRTATAGPSTACVRFSTTWGPRCKNTCRPGQDKTEIRFEQTTEPAAFQRRVFNLLG